MKLTKITKRPDYFEPEAGEPNECYSNVYLEVIHNPERVAVLGYIFKKGLPDRSRLVCGEWHDRRRRDVA